MDDILISASDVQVLLECWSPSPHSSALDAPDPHIKCERTPAASPVSSTLPSRQSAQSATCRIVSGCHELPAAVVRQPPADTLEVASKCWERRATNTDKAERSPRIQESPPRPLGPHEMQNPFPGFTPSQKFVEAAAEAGSHIIAHTKAPLQRQQNLLALHWPHSREARPRLNAAFSSTSVSNLQEGWSKVAPSPRSTDQPSTHGEVPSAVVQTEQQTLCHLEAGQETSNFLLSRTTLPVLVDTATTSRPVTPAPPAPEATTQVAVTPPSESLSAVHVQYATRSPASMAVAGDAYTGLRLLVSMSHPPAHVQIPDRPVQSEPKTTDGNGCMQTGMHACSSIEDVRTPESIVLPAVPSFPLVHPTPPSAACTSPRRTPAEHHLLAQSLSGHPSSFQLDAPAPEKTANTTPAGRPSRNIVQVVRSLPVAPSSCEDGTMVPLERKKRRRISTSVALAVDAEAAAGPASLWQWPDSSKDKAKRATSTAQRAQIPVVGEKPHPQKDESLRQIPCTPDDAAPISGRKRGRPPLTTIPKDGPLVPDSLEPKQVAAPASAVATTSAASSPVAPVFTTLKRPGPKLGIHPLRAAEALTNNDKVPKGVLIKATVPSVQFDGWFHGDAPLQGEIEVPMLMTGMPLPALLFPDTTEAAPVTVKGLVLEPRLQAITQADAAHKAAIGGDLALLTASSASRASILVEWPTEKCLPRLEHLVLPSTCEQEDIQIGGLKVHRLRSRPAPDISILSAQQSRLTCGCGTMQPASTPTVAYVQAAIASGRDRLPPLTLVLPSEYKPPAAQPRDVRISVSTQGMLQVSRAQMSRATDDAEYARQLEKTLEGTTSRSMRSISLAQKNKLLSTEQPFEICLSPDATLVSVMHSSLVSTEVIGLLAGRFSAETNKLIIRYAIPCRALPIEEDKHVNVELDPAHSASAHEFVHSAGLSVVGWYHSHPTFQADPSIRDIENQLLSQQAYCQPGNPSVPYVAMIISPNDPKAVGPWPNISFFQVRLPTDTTLEADVPMSLKATQDCVCVVAHEPASHAISKERTPKARPSRSKRPGREIEDATSIGFLSTSAESMLDDEGKANYLKEIEKLQPNQMRGFAYEVVVEPTPTERLMRQLTAQLQEGLPVKSMKVRATLLELSEWYAAEGQPFDAGVIAARAAGIEGRLDVPVLKKPCGQAQRAAEAPPSIADIMRSAEIPPYIPDDSSFEFEDPPCASVLAGFVDRYSHAYQFIGSQSLHCSFALALICDLLEYYRRFRFRVNLDSTCDYFMTTTNNELVTVSAPFLLRMEQRVYWMGSLFGLTKQELTEFSTGIVAHLRRCWT